MTTNAELETVTKDVTIRFDIIKHWKGKKGEFYVEGFGVTTDIDLEREKFDAKVLDDIAQSLLDSPTVFYNHDYKKEIGVIKETKVVPGKGVWLRILVSKTVPDIIERIKEGILTGLSIGGKVTAKIKEFVEDLGRTVTVITGFKAFEVSLVGLPANPHARSINWYIKSAFKDVGGEPMEIKKPEAPPAAATPPEVDKAKSLETPAPPAAASAPPVPEAVKSAEKEPTPVVAPEKAPEVAAVEEKATPAAAPAAVVPVASEKSLYTPLSELKEDDLEISPEFLVEAAKAGNPDYGYKLPAGFKPKDMAAIVENVVASLTKVRNTLVAASKKSAEATAKVEKAAAAAAPEYGYGYGYPAGVDPKKIASTIDSQIKVLSDLHKQLMALSKGLESETPASEAPVSDGGETSKSLHGLTESNARLEKQVTELTEEIKKLKSISPGSQALKGQETDSPGTTKKSIFAGAVLG